MVASLNLALAINSLGNISRLYARVICVYVPSPIRQHFFRASDDDRLDDLWSTCPYDTPTSSRFLRLTKTRLPSGEHRLYQRTMQAGVQIEILTPLGPDLRSRRVQVTRSRLSSGPMPAIGPRSGIRLQNASGFGGKRSVQSPSAYVSWEQLLVCCSVSTIQRSANGACHLVCSRLRSLRC